MPRKPKYIGSGHIVQDTTGRFQIGDTAFDVDMGYIVWDGLQWVSRSTPVPLTAEEAILSGKDASYLFARFSSQAINKAIRALLTAKRIEVFSNGKTYTESEQIGLLTVLRGKNFEITCQSPTHQ